MFADEKLLAAGGQGDRIVSQNGSNEQDGAANGSSGSARSDDASASSRKVSPSYTAPGRENVRVKMPRSKPQVVGREMQPAGQGRTRVITTVRDSNGHEYRRIHYHAPRSSRDDSPVYGALDDVLSQPVTISTRQPSRRTSNLTFLVGALIAWTFFFASARFGISQAVGAWLSLLVVVLLVPVVALVRSLEQASTKEVAEARGPARPERRSRGTESAEVKEPAEEAEPSEDKAAAGGKEVAEGEERSEGEEHSDGAEPADSEGPRKPELGFASAANSQMSTYHDMTVRQASLSFRNSQIAMAVGIGVLVGGAAITILSADLSSRIIVGSLSALGGTFSGYLSRTFLASHERTLEQVNYLFSQPLVSHYLDYSRMVAGELQEQGLRDKAYMKVVDRSLETASATVASPAQKPGWHKLKGSKRASSVSTRQDAPA